MKISDIQVELNGVFGSDDTVVNSARVSFEKQSVNYTEEQNHKLIRYLAKHKHHSPFNHAFLSFKVKAPLFCARQLVKHKFLPWNEVSRRYVDTEPEFYFPGKGNWRHKAENVKQGSGEIGAKIYIPEGYGNEDLWGDFDNDHDPDLHAVYDVENSLSLYNRLIAGGVAAEQARMILPQNTMTEWYWSGTLGAFLDMLRLRLDPHTQKESRDVAQLIAAHVKEAFPVSYHAVLEQ